MPGRATALVLAPIVLLTGLLVSMAAQQPSRAARDFEQAVTLMESRRDFAGAAKLFERVAGGSDRPLAAHALVYLGACYERLADDKARQAYRRVLDQFADQTQAASEARSRLAELDRRAAGTPSSSGLALRRLWNQRPSFAGDIGGPSADGLLVALINGGTGQIALQEMPSERIGKPIDVGSARGSMPACWPGGLAALSPDASEAAFVCEPEAAGPEELRVVRLDPQRPERRRLLVAAPGETLEVIEWRWREQLLIERSTAEGVRSLASVNLNGRVTEIVTHKSMAGGASMSPDGTWLVYAARVSETDPNRDVFIVPSTGGVPRVLVGDDRMIFFPAWSPDGSGVLFVSDRSGANGMWLQPVQRGREAGVPRLLVPDLGRIAQPLGLTRGGAYMFFRETGQVDVYVVELNADATPVGLPSNAGPRRLGENLMPTWSPDGRQLAYISRALGVTIRDLEDGTERVLKTPSRNLALPRWSPDGTRLLVRGWDGAGRYGWFSIDPVTGALTPLKVVPRMEESFLSAGYWDRDGRAIVHLTGNPSRLLRFHLDDGRDETLLTLDDKTTFSGGPNQIAVSATDGAIAFVQVREKQTSLWIRQPDGGLRHLLDSSPGDNIQFVAWLPENRGLLFTRIRTDSSLAPEARRTPTLWSIDLRTGAVRSLSISMNGFRDPAVSPDGRRLAFTAGWPSREPWVLENFLPPSAARAGRARR